MSLQRQRAGSRSEDPRWGRSKVCRGSGAGILLLETRFSLQVMKCSKIHSDEGCTLDYHLIRVNFMIWEPDFNKAFGRHWGDCLAVQCLPGVLKALGFVVNTTKTNNKRFFLKAVCLIC